MLKRRHQGLGFVSENSSVKQAFDDVNIDAHNSDLYGRLRNNDERLQAASFGVLAAANQDGTMNNNNEEDGYGASSASAPRSPPMSIFQKYVTANTVMDKEEKSIVEFDMNDIGGVTTQNKKARSSSTKPSRGSLHAIITLVAVGSVGLANGENIMEEEKKYDTEEVTAQMWKDLVLYIFLVAVILQNIYALARLINVIRALRSTGCFRKHHNRGGYLKPGTEPAVTIQICSYNEASVIGNTIDAACKVDWPCDKLCVQVLDDSTEEEAKLAASERVKYWKQKGMNCQYLTRPNREGYKAGNLKYHMESIMSDFVAFFDSDHLCDPAFLNSTVPFFFCHRGHKHDVGLVQAPWYVHQQCL